MGKLLRWNTIVKQVPGTLPMYSKYNRTAKDTQNVQTLSQRTCHAHSVLPTFSNSIRRWHTTSELGHQAYHVNVEISGRLSNKTVIVP